MSNNAASRLINNMTSFNRFICRIALITFAFDLLFVIVEGQHLVISPRQTQIKTLASGVIFTCTLMDYDTSLTPAPVMGWQSPQHSDISSARGRVYTEQTDVNNLRLYITDIEESDAGQYTCTTRLATSSVDSDNQTLPDDQHLLLSAEVKLFLFEEIQFSETPMMERNLLGSSALLQCIATGQPKPEVSWRFNRQRVISGNGKYVLEERGLRVNQLDLRDSGAYECRAEVESHGNVKIRTVNLDVLYPPVIMRNPTADLVVQGRNASLQCRADGNPPVFYEWFREQKISDDIRVKVRLAEGIDTFVIKDVDSEDEGRYFCRVTNTFGTKEVHVDVRMLVMPKIKPSFESRKLITEGATLNMSCEASGTPLPKIFWGRPGSREDYTKDAELAQLAKSGHLVAQSHPGLTTLVIRNVSRTLYGSLGCTAQSIVGVDTKNTTVVVEYKPSVSMLDPEQIAWLGLTRNFSCTADGIPVPTISWFHNDQYIIYNDTYSVTVVKSTASITSTLTMSIDDDEAWIYGKYTCFAKNLIGSVNDTAQLIPAVLPDSPRNVSVIDEQSTSVTLTAVAPVNDGGMPVTSWRVQYEPLSSDDDVMTNRRFTFTFTDEDKMEISDLRPGSTYTFYLAAGNALGYGTPVKFRVSTRRLSNVGEQLDVPAEEDTVNDGGRSRLGDAVVIEKKANEGDDNVLFTEGPIMVIALGTGLSIVLISCVLAVMCTFSAARRRQRKCQRQHVEKVHQFDDNDFVGVIDSKPPSNHHVIPLPVPLPDITRTARPQRCPEHVDGDTCSLCRHDSMAVRHSTSAHSCASKSSGGSQRQNRCGVDEMKTASRLAMIVAKQDGIDGGWIGYQGACVDLDRSHDQLIDVVGLPASISLSRQTTIDGAYCTFDDRFSSTVPKLSSVKSGCAVGVVRAGSLSRGGPLPKINQSPLIGVTSPTSTVANNVDLLPLRPFLLPVGLNDRYDVDPLANAAAINGYLSGENVDDDIDREDFTIRMPSVEERLCDFVPTSAAVAASWTAATANRELMQRN